MLAQLDVERTVVDGAVERLQVFPYDVVERRPAALVFARVGPQGLTHVALLRELRADAAA
jgi:hypothetical protein